MKVRIIPSKCADTKKARLLERYINNPSVMLEIERLAGEAYAAAVAPVVAKPEHALASGVALRMASDTAAERLDYLRAWLKANPRIRRKYKITLARRKAKP